MANMDAVDQISFDLVMEGEMSFVEGTYKLAKGDWQVFIFSRRDVSEPLISRSQWDSGVAGITVEWPRTRPLNQAAVEAVLGTSLGVRQWQVVNGPDSIILR
jgi:hypothetical protein